MADARGTHPGAAWTAGVDVGGTFADAVAVHDDGTVRRVKLLTDGRIRAACARVRAPGDLAAGSRTAGSTHALGSLPPWAAAALVGTHVRDSHGTESRVTGAGASADGCWITCDPGLADPPWVELAADLEAPAFAAHLLTETALGGELPLRELRVGTTRGTNALLEGRLEPVAAFVDEGLEGLPAIGSQRRLGLFDLVARVPPRIVRWCAGLRGRLGPDGVLRGPDADEPDVQAAAAAARAAGCIHAVVARVHGWKSPESERRVARMLEAAGFARALAAADVAPHASLLERMQTAAIDAGLTGAVRGMVARIAGQLPRTRVLVTASSGGAVPAETYMPSHSLLSGPAVGCERAAAAARAAGHARIIAFDMGGTSTDVARVGPDGAGMRTTTSIAGIAVAVPSVDIESVAAGGGSICVATPEGLFVGPASAGADPGPACFGRGGPLTLTDVNLLLGYLPATMGGVPLDRQAARARAEAARDACGRPMESMLRAFRALADELMANAVRTVTTLRGHEPADHVLVAYGGAGGQHACAVADSIGVHRVLVPANAGFVSADGARRAPRRHVEALAVREPLDAPGAAIRALHACARTAREAAGGDGTAPRERWTVSVRRAGRAGAIDVDVTGGIDTDDQLHRCVLEAVHARFAPGAVARDLEVDAVRVEASCTPLPTVAPPPSRRVHRAMGTQPWDGLTTPGPCVIEEPGATIVVPEGWSATVEPAGGGVSIERAMRIASPETSVDVVAARLCGIASDMAAALQANARSPNVRDRLDFSCGIVTPAGELCANAPNIPVHLGALGACVRALMPDVAAVPGRAILVNHPAFGGSHLPDLTVVRPVHSADGVLLGFVAARAHHAEIGGTRAGSMPPDARSLAEEGVAIAPMAIADRGALHEDALRTVLAQAPWPSRDPGLNVDDVRAAVEAVELGARRLDALASGLAGAAHLHVAMEALLARSAARTREVAQRVPDSGVRHVETLDDGSEIRVRIERSGDRLVFDFTGSGGVRTDTLNAPLAVTRSAVMYALRVLAGIGCELDEQRAPLNEGFLRGVQVIVPPGMLNPPFEADPAHCPAVFAGNTELSQRTVDAVLGAFGVVAQSQGTMNSVTIAGSGFAVYETLGGGAGAADGTPGPDAVHSHMTNTRLTDPEVLERGAPLRIEVLRVRDGSGGAGAAPGGRGMVRRIRTLAACEACVVAQRRTSGPRGAAGGGDGAAGRQRIVRADGTVEPIDGATGVTLAVGDAIEVETPGGGGWGTPLS
jgi:5-oxoprolinase (ATP-hydrolysing)